MTVEEPSFRLAALILRNGTTALATSLLLLSTGPAVAKATFARAVMRGYSVTSTAPRSSPLYDQDNDDSGYSIDSNNFTGDFSQYNAAAADDFAVPAGHKWRIKEVDVTGVYFSGSGPATSENVLIYKNLRGLPGTLVAECSNIQGIDNKGSFAIKIPKSCKMVLQGGRLAKGKTYWVSVVANIDFACCGAWAWETRTGQNGNPAAWENPNDGFGTGCTTWNALMSCFGDFGEGPDFMFALKGEDLTY